MTTFKDDMDMSVIRRRCLVCWPRTFGKTDRRVWAMCNSTGQVITFILPAQTILRYLGPALNLWTALEEAAVRKGSISGKPFEDSTLTLKHSVLIIAHRAIVTIFFCLAKIGPR